ncbi:50S ribosomal protein L3 [Treponema endosymbiont of Eucomonympha sp.]|uniref:50S ribosomal protein L3 n=1 Tax=Treponema endosymbiont of Eucomonympha sp. TaxID=1580831 RepID=UPI000784A2B7|nr:50S ribosomal protein L3 [Treponema endosymbiont of Eucomonympha sp.]
MKGLLAKKIGMTQIFDENGNVVSITVILVEPNVVVACKEKTKNGYSAVVLGFDDLKKKHITKPYGGQFCDGIHPKRFLKEFRDFDVAVLVGDKVGVTLFEGIRFLDVITTSKGKGFQGVVKRYGFRGGNKTHGSKFHREIGSTGQCTTPGHNFKNIKMPGRMGFEQVTVQNLRIIQIDPNLNVIFVRGAVPGNKNCMLIIKSAIKKQRVK